jgi:hypothetical protein
MLRKIAVTLALLLLFFGVPVLATLLAGKVGLPHRVVGWLTLVLMAALAYRARKSLGHLLTGRRSLPPTRPRRSHKRL